jgi:hypothetical protein
MEETLSKISHVLTLTEQHPGWAVEADGQVQQPSTGLRGGVFRFGEELTGRSFIGGGN